MILVRAALTIYADNDEAADAALEALLMPVKGASTHVNELSREAFDG